MSPLTKWAAGIGRRRSTRPLVRLWLFFLVAVWAIVISLPRETVASGYSELQWANRAIHLQRAWQEVPGRGAGTTVCDADTGAMIAHPDLKDAIVGGLNTANPALPSSFSDDAGHGTFTAGIIAARGKDIWGVAPGASLLVAKVLSDGNGDPMTVTSGILWCIDQGAEVINLSLGSQATVGDGFAEAISYGCRHGADFTVAAGNNATYRDPVDPARVASPCLIAVNASDQHDHLASFSNLGENTRTVSAPGESIISDWPNGGVALGSGTSASAPFVAGVLALLRSQGADARTAVTMVLQSARHPTGVRFVHGRSRELGYGILDAAAACARYAQTNQLRDRVP
jgi:major intracellular serine protease